MAKPTANSLGSKFAQWIIANRVLVIILNLLIVVIAATGLPPKFSTDYRMFFSEGNKLLANFEALERTYTKNDNVHFLIEAKSGNVFEPKVIKAVGELTKAGWTLPYSTRVDSIVNFQDTVVDGDEVLVQNLILDPNNITQAEADKAKAIAFDEIRLVDRLLGKKGHVTGVNITLTLPDPPPKQNELVTLTPQELLARPDSEKPETPSTAVQLSKQEWKARDDAFRAASGIVTQAARELMQKTLDDTDNNYREVLDIRLVGMTPFNQSFTDASQDDIGFLYPIAFLIMFVMLLLLLKNVFATLLTFFVIILSIITGLGFASWANIPLSPPASASIMIILTLAIAHSVHLFIAILYGMRRGEERKNAILESLRVNIFPIFLTSITTMIGFLCLNSSDAPPFADLGNIVAIGVVAGFVFGVTLLPAAATFLPLGRLDFGKKSDPNPKTRKADFMDKLGQWVIKRRTALLIGMTAVTIPLIGVSFTNDLDDVFMKYFAKSMQIRQDAEFVLDNYTGFDGLVYSLKAGDDQYDIADPEFLQKVDAFAQYWRDRKIQNPNDVYYVTTFTDTLKKTHQDLVGDGDKAFYKLGDTREINTALIQFFEAGQQFGMNLENELNQAKNSIRFTVIFGRVTSKEVAIRATEGRQWLIDNWADQAEIAQVTQKYSDDSEALNTELNQMVPPPNGTSMMFADISKRNIRSMVFGSVAALILISIILMFALRSLRLGLISLIPNLAPAGMAFGIWALTGQHVTVALSVVLGMTLGIVVDDTVHFLNAYLRAKREQGKDSKQAISYAFGHVGKALWTTSLVLVFGFAVLSFSAFAPNADMGLLTAITIGMALLADFLLLPPLLMFLDRNKRPA